VTRTLAQVSMLGSDCAIVAGVVLIVPSFAANLRVPRDECTNCRVESDVQICISIENDCHEMKYCCES
jgi:hypothetical protein